MDKKKLVTGEERAEAADGDVAVVREERFALDSSLSSVTGVGGDDRRAAEDMAGLEGESGESDAWMTRARGEW